MKRTIETRIRRVMRHSIKTLVLGLLATVVDLPMVQAQTGYPMLMSLKPVAVQVGQSSEVEFNSRYNLFGAYQVLVSGTGVSGEVLHPEKKEGEKPELTRMKVKFTIDSVAMPGVRDVKLATPQGVSTVGQLVVVRDPVVIEATKNDELGQAQEINIPSTVCGCIERNEDVDFFKFKIEAPTQLHFHMRSARLQDRIHDLQNHCDPMLTIRNATGSTIAASDNRFFGDPFLAYNFERAGEYVMEIRDVRYEGNQYWEYSVEISSRPFVTNTYPLGLPPGQETQIAMIGTQLPDSAAVAFTLPAETATGPTWIRLPLGEDQANPVPVYATKLPIVMETDADNDAFDKGQLITVPAGINGRISRESDVDCFQFEATKGERYTFEVRARRYQSALDPYIRILSDKGAQLQENDDLRDFKRGSADSRIDFWAPPADGKYTLEIRDMHLRGGDNFVYFIEAKKADPEFRLYADTDKTQLSPGTNSVVFVRAERRNGFTGEIQLHVEGLPPGVTAVCGRILPEKGDDGCIVFQTAADAQLVVSNVTIRGTASWKVGESDPVELFAVATVYQETYQPGGGRGHWPVESHTVSVGAPTDIRAVKLSDYDLTLKPGESKQIEVTIERAEGFDKNVTLDVMFQHLGVFANTLPPGVKFDEGKSSKLITGKNVKGHVVLTADANAAPVEKQLIPVTANVSLNFVMKTTFAADPLWITIMKP